ncbi:MAG: UbiA family prenyltransferase [Nitrososphaera sp.]|jgi:4-hydroxybenzoate polyprenyltransferase
MPAAPSAWEKNVKQHLLLFLHYVKARSNVYIFAFATFVSFLIGSNGNYDIFIALRAAAACYFLALATYIYNDVTDFKVDRINKTNRPSVTGKASRKQLAGLVSVLFGSSLALAATINVQTLLIASLCIALGVTYSHPRFNLKEKFPLKTVITAAGAALSSLLGGAAVANISFPVVYAALSFFLFFFVLGPLGDIGDLKGDRASGRRTFPIVLGTRTTLMMMFSVPVILFLLIVMHQSAKVMAFQNGSFGVYMIAGTCLVAMTLIVETSRRTDDAGWIRGRARPVMRLLHAAMQVSMLIAFL